MTRIMLLHRVYAPSAKMETRPCAGVPVNLPADHDRGQPAGAPALAVLPAGAAGLVGVQQPHEAAEHVRTPSPGPKHRFCRVWPVSAFGNINTVMCMVCAFLFKEHGSARLLRADGMLSIARVSAN